MHATVAVASGKGGVGKSTVALNLACALAVDGSRVGLLDADVYGPDIPRMVNVTRTQAADHIMLAHGPETGPHTLEPIEAFGISIMSIGLMIGEDQPLDWSSPLVQLLVRRFATDVDWGEIDVLVLDLPPGTADLQQFISASYRPDGVLLVVTPQDVAHLDAKKAVAMYERSGIPILGAVENMATLTCPDCDREIELFPPVRPERSIWHQGVERLASIPLDPAIAHAADDGRPAVVAHPGSSTTNIFHALARTVAAKLATGP